MGRHEWSSDPDILALPGSRVKEAKAGEDGTEDTGSGHCIQATRQP